MVVVVLGQEFSSSVLPSFNHCLSSSETASITAHCQKSNALSYTSQSVHLEQMTADCDLKESHFLFKLPFINTIAWKVEQRCGVMQKENWFCIVEFEESL